MPLCQRGGIGFGRVKYLNIKALRYIADNATKSLPILFRYIIILFYYCIKDLFLIHYFSLFFI